MPSNNLSPSLEDLAKLGVYDPKTDTWQATPMTSEMQDLAAAQQAGGRFAPLQKAATDWFLPFSSMRNPDTPETRQAYDQALQRAHEAGGGKVPQAPGSPRFSSPEAMALDLLANFGAKGIGAAKGLGALATKGAAAIHPAWISQRFPTAAGALENPLTDRLSVSVEAMQRDPNLMPKAVERIKTYPNLSEVEKFGTPEEVTRNFQNHIVQNLLWMYDQIPKNVRAGSAQWYEGANRLAREAADQYGIPLQVTSAVFARLSPRKDWYENADIARRLLETYFKRQNEPFSQSMARTAERIYAHNEDPKLIERISSGRLKDMQRAGDKAAWVRAWDEAENDPSHRIITPQGTFGDFVRTAEGQPAKTTWATGENVARSIQAIESGGNLAEISRLMGGRHKVRNFYNNILDPFSPMRDVTIDTHAVAAGLLRPLAGKDVEVAHNLSGPPKSASTGVVGTYPIFADAYREAARQRRVLPRQMQSITWEGARGLFPDTWKRNEANKKLLEWLWQQRGDQDIRELQDYILQLRGGKIPPPDWFR